MPIRYRLDARAPEGHRVAVAIDLTDVTAPTLDLIWPSWVPGSYHLVNYVRGVRGMTARAADGSATLPIERVEPERWRVTTRGVRNLSVQYTVYGHQMIDEALDVTSDHLFLNAALAFPWVDGHLQDPVELQLQLPSDWRVVTELEAAGGAPHTYRAPNYDAFVDSPLDAGHPLVLTIRPGGIPHRICLCGEGGNYESHRLEEDLGKIVDASTKLIGESPLTSYTFFVHVNDVPDGALEHATSNSAVVHRRIFVPAERYEIFLATQSHEYFHLWNVKRIRPKVLGPFDYTKAVPTGLLWWMEGTTDYFSDLILRRADLLSTRKYLEAAAEIARRFLSFPGRNAISVEELSRIAWVDLYQPFEETPNQSTSYYTKGYLVSLALDLEIRHRTETKASLETVVRRLWTEYGKPGRGLEEGEIQAVAERATGLELGDFFDRYVRGTTELDLDRFAQLAGLTFGPRPKPPDDDSPEPGYLGIRFDDAGGWARITHVLLDTPGYRAGLSPGDEIVALNGAKIPYAKFEKELESFPPGTPVDVTLFRRGYLRQVAATTGTSPPKKYRFASREGADALAQKVHQDWLGTAWEAPKPNP